MRQFRTVQSKLDAAAVSGAADWQDFDQRTAIVPPSLADALPGFQFAGLGACSTDAGVAHQYRPVESHRESAAWTTDEGSVLA